MSTVDMSYRMGSYGVFPEGKKTESRAGGKLPEKGVPAGKMADGNAPGKSIASREETGGSAFAERIVSVMENATAAENSVDMGSKSIQDVGSKSTRDMSPEEYAHYIYGIISELERRNYSRGNSVFIYISEEGFRAMQNDPEYEAWVMQNIRDAYYYAGHRGGHDGYHSAHFFGATKEEYRGQSWSFGCSKCDQERRQELKRRRKKQLQALLKKRHEQKLLEKQRREKMYLEKRRLEKAAYKKLLVKKETEEERLEEKHRKEALARREAASAFRMYMAILKYNEQ